MELISGEVWWARPDPGIGREQGGRRPVVVLSGALYNEAVTTLALIAPISTKDRNWPNHVELRGPVGLDAPSFAMTEQVRAISRERLERRAGQVTLECAEELRRWVRDYLVD